MRNRAARAWIYAARLPARLTREESAMQTRITPFIVVAVLGVSAAGADEGITRATNGATAT